MRRTVLLVFASYLALAATPATAQKTYDFTVKPEFSSSAVVKAGLEDQTRAPRLRLSPRITRDDPLPFEPRGSSAGDQFVGLYVSRSFANQSEVEVTIVGRFESAPTSSPYRDIAPPEKRMVIFGVKKRF